MIAVGKDTARCLIEGETEAVSELRGMSIAAVVLRTPTPCAFQTASSQPEMCEDDRFEEHASKFILGNWRPRVHRRGGVDRFGRLFHLVGGARRWRPGGAGGWPADAADFGTRLAEWRRANGRGLGWKSSRYRSVGDVVRPLPSRGSAPGSGA